MIEKHCCICKNVFVPKYNYVQTQKYCSVICRSAARALTQNGCWFTYVDYRLDTFKPFYVGVGNVARVNLKVRNKHHTRIVKKHGFYRELVFATSIRSCAIDEEIRLIEELKTREIYGGANFTNGGEGTVGWKPLKITRDRISKANTGRQVSELERKQRSIRVSGERNPNYGNRVERIQVTCAQCLTIFNVRASRHSKFCSRTCFATFLSKTRKGKNNPNHRTKKGLS